MSQYTTVGEIAKALSDRMGLDVRPADVTEPLLPAPPPQ